MKKKHPKTVFTLRLIGFVLVGIIGPLIIIYSQYQMFSPQVPNSVKVHGWGIIAAIILFSGIYYVITSLAQAFSNYGVRQIMSGVGKVIIPLVIAYLLAGTIAFNIDKIRIILLGILICQAIAIPLNPIPPIIYMREEKIGKKKP
jgi:hypothetical protein